MRKISILNDMFYKNILETIGNTPIVKINKLNPKKNVEIYAKLEGGNPGGSMKDRIALKMIEEAEASGELTHDKTIIEATSGNTGIALAMIGGLKGYDVCIVMSSAVSIERQKIIKAYGAEVILTDGERGTDGAIMHVKELIKKDPQKYYATDQYSNIANKLAHKDTTAREIWEQMDGKVDYFVAAVGTSGAVMGNGEALREYNPDIKIISAEPVEGHFIQGLKNMREAVIPAIYDKSNLDDVIMIDTEEAYEMTRRLVREEGIFAGMSSGAAMLASLKLAQKIDAGNIVTIFPDKGDKYLSTKLFV